MAILSDSPATPQVSRITFAQMIASAQGAGIVVAHLITPDCAVVPSATEPDTQYILVLVNGTWVCNCPAPGPCWHQARAAELWRAQAAAAPVTEKQARYVAAYADVFGEVAA